MRLNFCIGVTTVLIWALLLSCAPAADAPTEKEFQASEANLKTIEKAFHNYALTANNALPENNRDKAGVPLLSWRVTILPYLGEDELYRQFKFDEVWDSEHNKKLIAKMPKVYTPLRGKAKAGETFYQLIVGKGAVYEPQAKINLIDIHEQKLRAALVVEAGEPVVWTKPWDLGFDRNEPLPKLGGMFSGEFHVVLCDGSVIRVKNDADAKELKKLFTLTDSGSVNLKKLQK